MLEPAWLAETLTAVMLALAIHHVVRTLVSLKNGRHVEFDSVLSHALTGVGMAGMLLTRLPIFNATLWSMVFGTIAMWFIIRVILEATDVDGANRAGVRHNAARAVSALAMLAMCLAMPSTSALMPMSAR